MKVSVIIPTFNRAWTLDRAISSVLNQTYKNIEIIVVDDGSTDNTDDIVAKYKDKVKYIKHGRNMGANSARNTGIKNSSGKYITFLDSDDRYLPQKIEKEVELAEKIGKPCVIYCKAVMVYDGGRYQFPTAENPTGNIYKKVLEGFSPTSEFFTFRDSLFKIGLWDENVRAYQEWEINIRLSKFYEYYFIDLPLYEYYIHRGERIGNRPDNVIGYEYILEKYKSEILRVCGKEALEKHYLKVASLYANVGNLSMCRKYILKSFLLTKNPKRLLAFFSLLIGKDFYLKAREMVKNIKNLINIKN